MEAQDNTDWMFSNRSRRDSIGSNVDYMVDFIEHSDALPEVPGTDILRIDSKVFPLFSSSYL
jgi:hypothetical protein